MTFKTKTKAQFKLFLRRLGLLCKAPKKITRTLKISHTLNPDGTITVYDSPIFQLPENSYGIESEIHVFLEEKKLANPGCKFDTNTKTCVCGKTIKEFSIGRCTQNKQ
jgi:hypothetical protein